VSDTEKLRALLAEARECVDIFRRTAPWERDRAEAEAMCDRIDAALAEPVTDDGAWHPMDALKQIGALSDALTLERRLHKEARDEARAEVERLKADHEAAFFRGEDDGYKRGRRNGFQYGAEAMREAAANYVKHASHEDGLGMGSLRMEAGIRALPIPEDKP
jgi:flagellar biosynthesis/type III secretory pathway protein FliH